MAINYKCILVYGLTDDELDKIQKRRLKFKVVNEKNAGAKINDLLVNSNIEAPCNELPEDEKAIIFNGYNDKELRETIKFIRRFIEGGVLAVVTEMSSTWNFNYLLEHLIEEREAYKAQQRGK
ncbi:DUF3783 domain-containing protein [uncultured Clostridium sp.]|uniref:DUF3783 domain-containing protein n=1 Tax=uncultured Clostridium sp. TaxID=59620 RepID=UPI0025FF8B57|nr:DUF3783 domain-containing protein [uncultured Clostridium sp.]